MLGRFSEFSSFEQSGLIGVGDASALMELLTFFDALGLRGVRVTYADRLDGDDLKTNLVLLGGPDANLITNEAVKRIPTTLQFGDPSINQISIHDSLKNTIYIPKSDKSGNLVKDYGTIIRTDNPFALDKKILLIFGSYGYGTWAAAKLARSELFFKDERVIAGKSMECLIESDIVRATPQESKIIVLRELNIDEQPAAGSA